jgi:hypothetical protein
MLRLELTRTQDKLQIKTV